MKQISIVGFGRFGKTLYRFIKDDFAIVLYNRSKIDIDPAELTKNTVVTKDLSEVYKSDVIFYAVPISSFDEVISSHKKYFRESHLLIDVLSVKLHPAQVFSEHLSGIKTQALLTHPMFGPDSSKNGFEGLPMILDKFKTEDNTYNFWKEYFQNKKLKVIEMSADEHDKLAANSQGLTHFIGRLLEEYKIEETPIDSLGTKKLLEIKEQTCNDTWQLFTDLQHYNPHTKQMRLKLGEAYDKLVSNCLPDKNRNPNFRQHDYKCSKILSIYIKEKQKTYPIIIGESILSQINKTLPLSNYSKIAIITDIPVSDWVSSIKKILPFDPTVIILKPGETEKTIETVQMIWKKLIKSKFDRKSLVINLGGGVIGDMGGFAAATYMRGIDFVQMPTTLLSMVDASVGGKLAVDFEGYKNIVGSFVQPIAVIIDIDFLNTLPDREFISGFAEIIKHGLIADKKYFEFVTTKKPKEFSKTELVDIIARSCEIKSDIVQKDEQESGLRKILNFGHTIGHAIESLSIERKAESHLLHGEAIAIGMIAEAKLSSLIGNITDDDMTKIKTSIEKAGLPINCSDFSVDDILQKLQYDKKNERGKIKWTLLKIIGEAEFDIEVSDDLISQAIKSVI